MSPELKAQLEADLKALKADEARRWEALQPLIKAKDEAEAALDGPRYEWCSVRAKAQTIEEMLQKEAA